MGWYVVVGFENLDNSVLERLSPGVCFVRLGRHIGQGEGYCGL